MPSPDVTRWLDALPPELAAHADYLRSLVDAVERDDRWRWLELGGSVGDGRGDALSDLDLGLGHAGPPPPEQDVTALLTGVAPALSVHAHLWDGTPRWWVVHASGLQVDLVVLPADVRPGRAPGSVALVDRDGRLAHEFTPSITTASADDVHGWVLDGWEALANVGRYVTRGALREAVDQLHRARTAVLRTWAAAEDVRYPVLGLTSLLDDATAALPPGLDRTYARPVTAEVADAASATADLLVAASARVPGAAAGDPLVAHVRALLRR